MVKDKTLAEEHHGRRGKLLTVVASLSFALLILISLAAVLMTTYLHSVIIQVSDQQQTIQSNADDIETLNIKLTETRTVLKQLIAKLNQTKSDSHQQQKTQEVSVNHSDKRKKRDVVNDIFNSDDMQAEDDLSTLSLTGLSFLRGPMGFPGRDGMNGPAGAPGVQGPAGPRGSAGERGNQGERGLPGANGNNGQAGRDGLQGAIGVPGRTGSEGARGIPGVQGQKGETGTNGAAGIQGPPGLPGLKGEAGHKGAPGSAVESQVTDTPVSVNTTAIDTLSSDVETLKGEIRDLQDMEISAGTTSLRCPSWTRAANMSEVILNDNCYVLVKNKANWNNAKSFCESHGYSLVSFQGSTKQSIVEEWLISSLGWSTSKSFWTSGYRRQGDEITDWYWNFKGSEVPVGDYNDWRTGEPGSNDYCLAHDNLSWYGRPCTASYDFICEGPAARERLPPAASGEVYTHWGKRRCSNSSTTLYSGVVGGPNYDVTGGGVDYQCLPPNPELNNYNPSATDVSWIRSVEYESQNYGIFPDGVDNTHAVCSKCFTGTRSAVLTIPAKRTCPEDWTHEYSGYMMASKENAAHPSTYVCVDSDPDYLRLPNADAGGRWYFVNVDCTGPGSVGQCSSYINKSQMTCVVCSR